MGVSFFFSSAFHFSSPLFVRPLRTGSTTRVKALVIPSCLTLCDSMDCSLLSSSVHGVLQAQILEWVAIPLSRGSFWPRDWAWGSYTAGRFFTIWATRKPSISTSLFSSLTQWLSYFIKKSFFSQVVCDLMAYSCNFFYYSYLFIQFILHISLCMWYFVTILMC